MEAEARLQHLERVVHHLAAQQGNSAVELTKDGAATTETDQVMNEGVSQTFTPDAVHKDLIYSGPTHWSSMLEDIQAIRSGIAFVEVSDDNVAITPQADEAGTTLIFGSSTIVHIPLAEVLQRYLPTRQETDRLTSAYFRAKALAAPFVHPSQFWRLYQAFWSQMDRAPPLWISLLFSICHVAKNKLQLGSKNEKVDYSLSAAAAQCLTLGEYFRPQRFAVEALLLYAHSQCLTNLKLPSHIGSIFGLLVRLATSMGYHKDPSPSKYSPFEIEMRRRTWSLCMQLDLLISFHLGLPSVVQFPTWNTKPPANLLSSDFDENSFQLPTERPDTELTEVSFYIAKHRFMVVFETILRHVLSTEADPESSSLEREVDGLNREITNVSESLPEILRPRKMTDSVIDPPNLIVTRLCVSFLHQKCLCVLHRPYVTRNRLASIAICYQAARGLVQDFVEAFRELSSGGQLETEQWFMSSISWHDFLLGLTCLCLVFCAASQMSERPEFVDEVAGVDLFKSAQVILAEQVPHREQDTARVQALVKATIHYVGTQNSARSLASMPSSTQQTTARNVPSDLQTDVWGDLWTGEASSNDPTWAYLEQFMDIGTYDVDVDV